jgi:ribonucleoside-diphosphate reductase alpha chain
MGLKTTYYLRTMGASGVEKSTVELDAASQVNPQPQEIAACNVDDPNCETCQ